MNTDRASVFRFAVRSQYFLYFGVLGIFIPYFNLYCYHLGFSGFQIGTLSAIRSLALVLFPLFWGIMADRFHIRRPLYILCNFISTAIWISYFYTANFWAMLAITFCYGIFYAPIISFLEAFTMDILSEDKDTYGRIRVWGSISFILIVLLAGKIIDVYSIRTILVGVLVGSVVQALLSTGIPKILIPQKEPFISKAKGLLKIRVVVFLFCGFLMLLSHGTYYGFYSIHLENLGYGNTFIGIAWALASIAEILVMIKSDRIFKRFSIENVLVFSFVVAAIRWFVLFYAKSPAAILFFQILHAVTYGTFHMASILYIDFLAPEEAKTLGQALNNALSYGLGMMVGVFINGYLYESVGSSALFIMSGFIALAGGALLKGFQIVDCRFGEGLEARIENRMDGNS